MPRTTVLDAMFCDVDSSAERAALLEDFKAKMGAEIEATSKGLVHFDMATKTLSKAPAGYIERSTVADRFENLTKSLTADQLASLGEELSYVQDFIRKDWTPSNPVSSPGLVPYDLEGPAKVLSPRDTPLRNTIPREKGQGSAREFRRITSITNDGVSGGQANAMPFFNSQTSTSNWGSAPVVLNRPPKIGYTGDKKSVGYVELGFSDSVSFISQFEGLGFDDIRALSKTALLWAHLLGEERADLYARGSGTGYAGVVSAPSGITTATATTGGTIAAATYFIYVAGNSGQGESALSTVASQVTTGSTSTITITIGTEPAGALNYNVYVGTVTGAANAHYQGQFVGNVITLTAYNSTSAAPANTDTSASALAYDGFLTVQSVAANGGYLARLNAALSTTTPGGEFDTALQTMFVNNGADPDEIWMTGANRTSLGQLMRVGGASGAASGYRTNVVTGDTSATMSTSVTGFVNSNTNKVLDVKTHRFMPAGAALIRSLSLPIPDSHVTAPTVKVNVQDYMAFDWPLLQMSYDASTYQIGTLVHYAPAWNGLVMGIK